MNFVAVLFLLAFSQICLCTQTINGHGNVAVHGNSNHVNNKSHTNNPTYDSQKAQEDLEKGAYRNIYFDKKAKTPTSKERVLILTATNYETKMFHKNAKELGFEVKRGIVNDQTVYNLGDIGGIEVFQMQPSMMGMLEPGSTLLVLMSVFKDLNPKYIITTGIAFGRKSKGQKLGDIIVSRQIANYETRKEKTGDIYFRGDKVTSPMMKRINPGIQSWKGVKVHDGLVLSGNVLINSKEFLKHLEKREPEYIGGDMESYGAYAVASMMGAEWIMIKGISDWGDGTKNDDHHQTALNNVSKFILHLIKDGFLK